MPRRNRERSAHRASPPRFSRYRRSRPLIPYLNISAISV
ncbi:hypothetical protein C7S17_6308 [Burkholderia thailandensis]|nr:hypothetical protein [Burkholderia thailandensis]